MEMRAQKSEPGSSLGLFGNTNQKGGVGNLGTGAGGSPRFLTARKGSRTGRMQWQVLRVEPCGGQELRRLHPSHPLPACQPADQPLERRAKSPRTGAWAPTSSILHLCRGSLPREGVGGTCTWPGQERKVTHTKFNNQQRHILAAPCSPQAVPPPRVQSLWPAPNSLLGPEERGAGPRCVSLSRLPPWHLLDRRWREGGGLGLPPPCWGSPG